MGTQALMTDILPENYKYLQAHVYAEVGIVLEENKQYLFQSRLAPIVKHLGLHSVNELCSLLHSRRNPEIGQQVVEAMTTNETYFFRDPAQYEAIKKELMPRLKVEHSDTRKLRFWSAASSTGQEAFSLGMMLIEEGYQDWNIQIQGTDFNSKVIERARKGTFQQIEMNRGLPTNYLLKYFKRAGLEWQISDDVRKMVRFDTIDLRKSMRTMGPFDLVFCRNVLIYFDNETKRNILKELHSTLFRGGWLLLGGAETVFGLEEWFDRKIIGNVTAYVAR